MNTFMRHASIASTIALMTVGTAGLAGAQSKTGYDQNACIEGQPNCPPRRMQKPALEDQSVSKKRLIQQEETQATDQPRRVRQAQTDWRFDANRHERRRHRSDRFRFEFGGFWYPEPYWLGYGLAVNYRIGCGEGRAIVRDRGFRRVRTVECRGRTYTYLGRRQGDTFRVLVSSRSGRIVDVDPV
jgi:hypothetical protein